MRLLFIGGTGNLSRDCTELALSRGHEVFHLNRGRTAPDASVDVSGIPSRVGADGLARPRTIVADVRDSEAARAALRRFVEEDRREGMEARGDVAAEVGAGVGFGVGVGGDTEHGVFTGAGFDAVVDFIAFRPEEALADFELFSGMCRQFVFISSASVYTKPSSTNRISEDSPVGNPHWSYAADKLECELALRSRAECPAESRKGNRPGAASEVGCPALTIVRPSLTYSTRWIPSPFVSSDFTLARRILDGKALVVPGDGCMRWTITHTRDFAFGLLGLLGNEAAFGRTVQITSEEAPTWNEIHLEIAAALEEALESDHESRGGTAGAGLPITVPEPRLVHIPIDFIADVDRESGAKLLGDKGYTSLFDCSLLKSIVPDFAPSTSFSRDIRESVAWFLADPERRKTNPAIDATMDRILAAWSAVSESDPRGEAGTEMGSEKGSEKGAESKPPMAGNPPVAGKPHLILDGTLRPFPLRAGLIWGFGLRFTEETVSAPAWLSELLAEVRLRGEEWFEPERKAAVRAMLRFGKYKPAGRSKPSSEYLLAAAIEGDFPLVNPAVDINNGLSLRTGYPASIFDLARSGSELALRRGIEGEEYVFNRSGQAIDLRDLLCVCRRDPVSGIWMPCGNPVKDAMSTKVFPGARDVAAVLYAPAGEDPARLEVACADFAALLRSDCGSIEAGWSVVAG